MESMLFLGNGPPVPRLARIPSSLSSKRETKLHFSLKQTCAYSLTSVNACRPPIRHDFYPVIRALDDGSSRPSRNNRYENKIRRTAVGASVALSCVLGIIGACFKMSPKAVAGPRELYQKAPQVVVAYPLGGRSALKSLLDVNVYLSSKLDPPGTLSRLPLRPSAEEVNGIKMEAIRLMKYGKPEEAVFFLRNAYNNYYKYDPEPAYNVDMALVEILICQGKYMEALECNCLKDDQRIPSDGRFPLYKAIIYTMLGEKEEARKWWEEYVETVEGEFDPTSF